MAVAPVPEPRARPRGPAQPGFALEAVAGVGAAAFAALVLSTLPAFLGLAPTAPVVLDLLGATATAYFIAGPHAGGSRIRALVPLGAAALGLLVLLVTALVPGGLATLAGFLGGTLAAVGAWGSGAAPTLAEAAALPIAALLGLAVGLPVFHAARAGRPAVALLLGFALLIVEWEFVDNATVRLFWPLVGVGLFWLAADRARETARQADRDVGSPTPWTAFGMAGLAALIILAALAIAPRQGGPANLGRLGIWIDGLPVIGPMERATREGDLGYGPGVASRGSGSGTGTGGAGGVGPRPGGFSLRQTGFSPDVAHLGGPASPSNHIALQLDVSGAPAVPTVLYLRGAVRDIYSGAGWVADPATETADPSWPSVSADGIGRAFLTGSAIPAPYTEVSARIEIQAATSANLFTLLLPLRLAAPGVTWDQAGEAWTSASLPQGFGYSLTAAVLPASIWDGTGLASYVSAVQPGQAVSPMAALALAQRGVTVARAPGPVGAENPSTFPLAADLQLPAELPAAVGQLAKYWTAPAEGDPLLQALAIQSHLQSGYAYTLDAPVIPTGADFVDYFLFDARAGYCTSFSTAMVVLLRSIGIPARWVEGYRVAVPAQGGAFDVRDVAAHAWIEAYIAPYGWLTFDPTPAAAVGAQPLITAGTPGGAGLGLRQDAAAARWWVLVGLPAGLLLLLLGSAMGNLLGERRAAASPALAAQGVWRACERVGARFGCPRQRSETPAEYLAALGARFPDGAQAAAGLAAEYGRLRYGRDEAPAARARAARLQDHWRALQLGLRRAAPLTYPLRRWL